VSSSSAFLRPTSRPWLSVCFIVLGLVSGLLTFVLSIGLAGGGHGWNTPAPLSLIALVTSPLSCLAWAYRYKALGVSLAFGLLVVMLVADMLLYAMTQQEGSNYFYRVWPRYREDVLAWASMWLVWQVVTVACLVASALRYVTDDSAAK
jgi:hypothetical protein